MRFFTLTHFHLNSTNQTMHSALPFAEDYVDKLIMLKTRVVEFSIYQLEIQYKISFSIPSL